MRGELIAAYYALLRLQQSTTIVAAICDAMIEEKFGASFPFKFPTFHCSVYEANAHRIGIIGTDLAADIA